MSKVVIDISDGVIVELELEERTDAQERRLAYERAAAFKAKHGCQSCNHVHVGACSVPVGKGKCPCARRELKKATGPVQKKAQPAPPPALWEVDDDDVG